MGKDKPKQLGTVLNSMGELKMPAPERSDGMKRVKVAPEDPWPNNRNTRHRACRGVDGRDGAEAGPS